MKATYLKPTTEEILISSAAIMITASGGDGDLNIGDGGGTGDSGVTEGDARLRYDVWEDED